MYDTLSAGRRTWREGLQFAVRKMALIFRVSSATGVTERRADMLVQIFHRKYRTERIHS